MFTRRDYEAMRRETSVFTNGFAMVDYAAPVEGRLARSAFVTGNFFQVLGVQATLGRPLLPEDDERGGGRPVIVLSHAGWRKLFQGERAVIGRRVVINGVPSEIVGVMPDGFRGLGITPPDYWAPLSLAEQFRDDAAGRADEIAVEVGRLKPARSREAATGPGSIATHSAPRDCSLSSHPGARRRDRRRPHRSLRRLRLDLVLAARPCSSWRA